MERQIYLRVICRRNLMLSVAFLKEGFTYSIDKFSSLITDNYSRATVSTEHLHACMHGNDMQLQSAIHVYITFIENEKLVSIIAI